MTIDDQLLGAVRHYLMGNVGIAKNIHGEIKYRGERHAEEHNLSGEIAKAKTAFLKKCEAILAQPACYAHKEGYTILPEDKAFLESLLEEGEKADWNIPAQVEGIVAKINEYAPHGGFGGRDGKENT